MWYNGKHNDVRLRSREGGLSLLMSKCFGTLKMHEYWFIGEITVRQYSGANRRAAPYISSCSRATGLATSLLPLVQQVIRLPFFTLPRNDTLLP